MLVKGAFGSFGSMRTKERTKKLLADTDAVPGAGRGAVHVERQQNGDEELFRTGRPPLLVNDLAAVAKLVMSSRQAWAHHILLHWPFG